MRISEHAVTYPLFLIQPPPPTHPIQYSTLRSIVTPTTTLCITADSQQTTTPYYTMYLFRSMYLIL